VKKMKILKIDKSPKNPKAYFSGGCSAAMPKEGFLAAEALRKAPQAPKIEVVEPHPHRANRSRFPMIEFEVLPI
jgi:hypothetical protein